MGEVAVRNAAFGVVMSDPERDDSGVCSDGADDEDFEVESCSDELPGWDFCDMVDWRTKEASLS